MQSSPDRRGGLSVRAGNSTPKRGPDNRCCGVGQYLQCQSAAVPVCITKLADRRPRREARPEAQIIGLELQQTKTAPGPHVQIDRFHQQQPDPGYCSIVSWPTGISVQLEHGLRQEVYLRKFITQPCWPDSDPSS